MPLAIDPEKKLKIVLESDKGKKPEPYFEFKHSTKRQFDNLLEIIEKIDDAQKDDDLPFDNINELFKLVSDRMTSWGNMINPSTGKPIPYVQSELDSLITVAEAFELLYSLASQLPGIDDKKKLESQSPSSSGKSVKRVRAKRTAKRRLANTTVKASDA